MFIDLCKTKKKGGWKYNPSLVNKNKQYWVLVAVITWWMIFQFCGNSKGWGARRGHGKVRQVLCVQNSCVRACVNLQDNSNHPQPWKCSVLHIQNTYKCSIYYMYYRFLLVLSECVCIKEAIYLSFFSLTQLRMYKIYILHCTKRE